MSKILVTGAGGDIGKKTVLHLLKKRPPADIVGFVRDHAKAADLQALGVEVRQGDYFDRESLERAFNGIDKVMLTSAHAFTDRKTAQGNVIEVAASSRVKHLVYMSIARKAGSDFTMPAITPDDLFTEETLKSSGLAWTIAMHPPFLDVLGFYIGMRAHETGLFMPAGDGKFAAASRDDLAAAHAQILSGDGHESKTYSLTGDPAVSFRDIAAILAKGHGREVPYTVVSDAQYLDLKRESGLPDFVVEFVLKWVQGINAGEWAHQTRDLENLIGHKPMTANEYFRDHYPAAYETRG